jgi:hypothetical protein
MAASELNPLDNSQAKSEAGIHSVAHANYLRTIPTPPGTYPVVERRSSGFERDWDRSINNREWFRAGKDQGRVNSWDMKYAGVSDDDLADKHWRQDENGIPTQEWPVVAARLASGRNVLSCQSAEQHAANRQKVEEREQRTLQEEINQHVLGLLKDHARAIHGTHEEHEQTRRELAALKAQVAELLAKEI